MVAGLDSGRCEYAELVSDDRLTPRLCCSLAVDPVNPAHQGQRRGCFYFQDRLPHVRVEVGVWPLRSAVEEHAR